ncbi:MAG: alpha/beta hydrolase [Alphaproteobacteria bacterium]|nr:alpha/beta hydrolase [Alphaproteobacteria bacterium]MBU1514790.1 alpha/beta hydrolase [Alphaproteobacteria bacterium]MBU2093921.1 alpha/beta hydrolase [Alphaproteobacteria bacterium]MBU2153348.1 alpha/beta hydrolase [Alphaproteobacteria bacterium]MBU2309776.1 alpha/beta hydrolase [Alphaproteobacteria bacterium]
MPEFRTIDTGRAKLRAAVEGEGPLVIMVHGFPESWYSWRHQIGPVAKAGYQVVALDVRGYGGSDKPKDVAAYSMQELTGDVAGVAEGLAPGGKAILMGHDWGAPIVWNTALTRPDVISAVAGLSVPYTGVPHRPFTEIFTELFTSKGHFFYQAWFQDVGPPEAEAEGDVRDFLRKFYYGIAGEAPDGSWPVKKHGASMLEGMVDPEVFPAWLTPEDLDYYVAEFEGSGFFGPISRYRNHERDFEWLQAFKDRKIEQPSLLIGGDRDPAFNGFGRIPDPAALMRGHVTDLRSAHILPGVGHWTQQERPAEVTAILLDWLKGL